MRRAFEAEHVPRAPRGARGAGGSSAGDDRRDRHRLHGLRVGTREPGEDGRVRRQPDHVSRRERAVELGHRQVLVDDPAAVERDHPHDLVDLERERHDDCAHPRRELTREPEERGRVPVRRCVVDGHPAVPRPDHARPARADATREVPTARSTSTTASVCTWTDANESRGARCEPLPERRRGATIDERSSREAPAVVHGARHAVGREHLEVEVLHSPRRERLTTAWTSAAATPPRRASGAT